MDNRAILFNLAFSVIGGLGLFLLGMKNLSDGLQAVSGDKLRKLIGIAANNRFLAIGTGTLVTCIIQSSTITTVTVVGFVNSGLMTLKQAIGVIMGANIGTTLTGWILAINIGIYGMPIMGLAAIVYLFAKREKLRYIAMALLGIGMVLFGLELMKNGFKPIRDIPEYLAWFQRFTACTYFGVIKCALVGCIVTLIIQSSSATLGITMGLAASGIINFETAAALVVGENLGTTFTAYLASIGTSPNGRRTAYFHILFNLTAVIWITSIFAVYIGIIQRLVGHQIIGLPLGESFDPAMTPHILVGIAMVHTGFSLSNTLFFLPFTNIFAQFLTRLVPDKPSKEIELPKLTKLNQIMLNSPVVGIAQSRHEIVRMGRHNRQMLDTLKTLISGTAEDDETLVQEIFSNEDVLDSLQREITYFLTDMLSGSVPQSLSREARVQMLLADEYETASDYITTLAKLYMRIKNANGVEMPEVMRKELLSLHDLVSNHFDLINDAYSANNRTIISDANKQGDAITANFRDLRSKHLTRLSESETPIAPMLSTVFPDMLTSYRRIKDHMLNIAEAMARGV